MNVTQLTDPGASQALLDPTRQAILGQLREPGSASSVARHLGLSRQSVNYHVRALEEFGLLREVGRRMRRNCEERIVESSSRSYLIAPSALGPLAATPAAVHDRLSAEYLVATAARTLDDLRVLTDLAQQTGKRLPTLTVDAEVRFATPQRQAEFAASLRDAVLELVERFHEPGAEDGRSFRFTVMGHPAVPSDSTHSSSSPSADRASGEPDHE